MALDEAIFIQFVRPALRIYRWAAPAVSFGYFEKWPPIREAFPGREPVRRWTGGGVVPHGDDFTYSLLVPSTCAFFARDLAASYRAIHEIIAEALREFGFDVVVAETCEEKTSSACFENFARHDILLNNRKVGGAAQRRTGKGFLHQGSLQKLALPSEFSTHLAARFSRQIQALPIASAVLDLAEKLAAEKYGAKDWLTKF